LQEVKFVKYAFRCKVLFRLVGLKLSFVLSELFLLGNQVVVQIFQSFVDRVEHAGKSTCLLAVVLGLV
jgi:hypothetical protein